MIAAKRLPEVLKSVLSDGVDGVCIMTDEGSILASAFTDSSPLVDNSLAAIASSIWSEFSKNPDVGLHIVKFEHGCLGITSAGKGYILAVYGETIAMGLLRGRLNSLSSYFTRMFEQLK